MKAIKISTNNRAYSKYFTTETKAYEWIKTLACDGKVRNSIGEEVSELCIPESGDITHCVNRNTNTIFDMLGFGEAGDETMNIEASYIEIE